MYVPLGHKESFDYMTKDKKVSSTSLEFAGEKNESYEN